MFDFDERDEHLPELLEDYNKLPESVRKFITIQLMDDLNSMIFDIENCESPIEQMMSIALNRKLDRVIPHLTNEYFIDNQVEIEAKGKTYRVDFLVRAKYEETIYDFVIECDGHEFHEKTKEQAKRDKKRDRDLIAEGYTVIRFTGSEIYRNPMVCASEVIKIISNRIIKGI